MQGKKTICLRDKHYIATNISDYRRIFGLDDWIY
jgi:hypothetical protein